MIGPRIALIAACAASLCLSAGSIQAANAQAKPVQQHIAPGVIAHLESQYRSTYVTIDPAMIGDLTNYYVPQPLSATPTISATNGAGASCSLPKVKKLNYCPIPAKDPAPPMS